MKNNIQCIEKILYVGSTMTDKQMSELYELSDCYVSPFMAEGFNLPVLESLCHGLNVICTKGGPPDEFAKDAYFIDSIPILSGHTNKVDGEEVKLSGIYPSNEHFLKLMQSVIISKKRIDKNYYKTKYSCENIGNMLFEKMKTIISQFYNIPEVYVENTDFPLTQNIKLLSGSIKLCTNEIRSQKYIYID